MLQNRSEATGLLDTPETTAALASLTNYHPDTNSIYWGTRLLLEWYFGRFQVHQLISHNVLTVEGWSTSPDSLKAPSDLRVLSLPQVLLPAASPLLEALDYKLFGIWPSQISVATRALPVAQMLLNTDAAINFWLPESVLSSIDTLGNELELSRSDVIRNILFLHLYGRVFYEDCLAQENWRTRWRDAGRFDGEIMFSRSPPSQTADQARESKPKEPEPAPRTAYVETYGKSNQSIKVWLPTVMREHLETINDTGTSTLAEYVRRTLTTDLLGCDRNQKAPQT